MATLAGSTISSTYKTLLKTDSSAGLTSALTTIEDGDGTASAISLSTVALNVAGNIGVNLSTTTINADLHIKSTSSQGILVEDSSGYDSFYVGDSLSKFNCKMGDIDNSSSGNDSYIYLKDSSNSILLKGTYTGVNQTSPTATLHVGNNDATVKFALSASTTAMIIGDAGNTDIVNIDTVSDKVRIEGDFEVTGTASFSSKRYKLEEYFSKRPAVHATVQAPLTNADASHSDNDDIIVARAIANTNFEVLGTNASSEDITFSSTYAGLQLQTDGADNDQIIIAPHLDTDQTAWTGIKWGSENQTEWECAITTGDAVADYSFWAGLKLTNTANYQTDANQAYFLFATDDTQSGGILATNTKLHFVYSVGDDDYVTDLGITVATSTTYRLRIKFDTERKLSIFVNGTQYGLSQIKTYDATTATNHSVTVNNSGGYSASGSPVTIVTDGTAANSIFYIGDILCDSAGNIVGTITSVSSTAITVSSVTEAVADDEALYKFGGVAASATTKSIAMTDDIDYIPYVGLQQLAGSKTSTLVLHYEKISRILFE